MPRLDGLSATRQLRASGVTPEELPIVALTANAFADDIAACRAAGMQDHLAKPLSSDALRDVLVRYLSTAAGQVATANIPPVSDRLRALYDRRRGETLDALSHLLADRTFDPNDRATVAGLLHKLAGTAAMFGEAELGARAGALEDRLRDGSPEWPDEARTLLRAA